MEHWQQRSRLGQTLLCLEFVVYSSSTKQNALEKGNHFQLGQVFHDIQNLLPGICCQHNLHTVHNFPIYAMIRAMPDEWQAA